MLRAINIYENRKSVKYARSEQLKRIVWTIVHPLFRFSPRPFFGWRRFMLRSLGAQVGENVHIYGSATIYFPWKLTIGDNSSIGENAIIYNLGMVWIGANATISQRAHLCAGTHDYTRSDMRLEKPPIIIGDLVWICAEAFIGPGVTVEEAAVVAARSVVVKDVAAWSIVGGNPARYIKKRMIVA
jgi:putative colanic acid biosynthesis acetyltransferase WcaF